MVASWPEEEDNITYFNFNFILWALLHMPIGRAMPMPKNCMHFLVVLNTLLPIWKEELYTYFIGSN